MDADNRSAAEGRWLALTRVDLPAVARARGWPVHADHCFQRIFLDNACDGVWYDRIAGRPAYAHADRALLDQAIALAQAALDGRADLPLLNRRSLAWRHAQKCGNPSSAIKAPASPARGRATRTSPSRR